MNPTGRPPPPPPPPTLAPPPSRAEDYQPNAEQKGRFSRNPVAPPSLIGSRPVVQSRPTRFSSRPLPPRQSPQSQPPRNRTISRPSHPAIPRPNSSLKAAHSSLPPRPKSSYLLPWERLQDGSTSDSNRSASSSQNGEREPDLLRDGASDASVGPKHQGGGSPARSGMSKKTKSKLKRKEKRKRDKQQAAIERKANNSTERRDPSCAGNEKDRKQASQVKTEVPTKEEKRGATDEREPMESRNARKRSPEPEDHQNAHPRAEEGVRSPADTPAGSSEPSPLSSTQKRAKTRVTSARQESDHICTESELDVKSAERVQTPSQPIGMQGPQPSGHSDQQTIRGRDDSEATVEDHALETREARGPKREGSPAVHSEDESEYSELFIWDRKTRTHPSLHDCSRLISRAHSAYLEISCRAPAGCGCGRRRAFATSATAQLRATWLRGFEASVY